MAHLSLTLSSLLDHYEEAIGTKGHLVAITLIDLNSTHSHNKVYVFHHLLSSSSPPLFPLYFTHPQSSSSPPLIFPQSFTHPLFSSSLPLFPQSLIPGLQSLPLFQFSLNLSPTLFSLYPSTFHSIFHPPSIFLFLMM